MRYIANIVITQVDDWTGTNPRSEPVEVAKIVVKSGDLGGLVSKAGKHLQLVVED